MTTKILASIVAVAFAGLAACTTPPVAQTQSRSLPTSSTNFPPNSPLKSPLKSQPTIQAAPDPRLTALLSAAHRSPGNVARDGFRHPLAVIDFFDIRDDSTVVEILPGSGGYYLEILAPFLKEKGLYIAANRDEAAPPNYLADHRKLLARLQTEPSLYGKVQVTPFNAGRHEIAPAGSADVVLSFRNIHNWIASNELKASLETFHHALKPGGVFGIVGHRGRAELPQEQQTKNGYVRQDVAIALIEQAGFVFDGASEVNANPKDTKDYPAGVWTLPPTYRLKDQDRAVYQAIGESDRFTLRFIKRR